MNKKALILISLMTLSIMAIPCVPTVHAKITEVNDLEGYTEYYGTIGGANFYVLIPDDWTNFLGDGMLVVMCDNYDVTGKIFLFGTSLGGNVALLLGERHPDVYSGVLDNSGIKDWAAMYNDAVSYSGSDPFLLFWYGISISSYENNYGGTPEERPNKYAKYSPTHHADMAIPVISVVHVDDAIVNATQTDLYHAALSDPSLHMIVTVTEVTPGAFPYPGATGWYGHFDPYTFTAAATNLFTLIVWSNILAP